MAENGTILLGRLVRLRPPFPPDLATAAVARGADPRKVPPAMNSRTCSGSKPGRIGIYMVGEPHAFLSYTHLDDEGHDGAIPELRKRLERSVRVVTGDPSFTIFQDHDGIAFGQHWPSRLDEALAGGRFLLPVVRPR